MQFVSILSAHDISPWKFGHYYAWLLDERTGVKDLSSTLLSLDVVPVAMNDIIEECRRRRQRSNKIKLFNKLRDQIEPPQWMKDERDTRFLSQYRDQELLISSAKVVWGQIVQANAKLFQVGDYDHPAAVVYSVDPHYDRHPQELALVAQHLFEQKGQQETARDLKEFSRVITDEYETVFNLKVPNAYTNDRNVYYTSTMVPRKYLPDHKLSMSFFPYLVLPSSTEASMILPYHYWPKFLVSQWKLKGNTGDRVSMGTLLKA